MTRDRVLILRPLGLGDLLTAVPALRAIAGAFPRHQRVLAAPIRLSSLVKLSGAIDTVVDARPLQALPIGCHHPDVAIDLHGRGPESHRILLNTGPNRLIAFSNPEVPETRGFPRWRSEEHEVDRWCRLLSENGIPADPRNLDIDPPDIEPLPVTRGAIIIHPGAAYPARRWPLERWAAVAHALAPGVVITGSTTERPLAMELAQMAGISPGRVLAGSTDAIQLAVALAAARLLISADTGVAHLATALRTPSVVLFGPSAPSQWGPPTDRPWHRVIWKGRRGDPNGVQPDPGLLAITVKDVLTEVGSLTEAGNAVRA
jgi:ADP-heptose:LPS heptosyltransferase